MARTITILHTPGCPNLTLVRQRLSGALARLDGPGIKVIVEEISDPDEATRRGLRGSPALLIDNVDPFTDPQSPPAFACRIYHTESGVEGAPSIDQIAAALAAG